MITVKQLLLLLRNTEQVEVKILKEVPHEYRLIWRGYAVSLDWLPQLYLDVEVQCFAVENNEIHILVKD